jgi:X-X-X-Leu-X-X-Gly heptad repeat protein
LGLGDPHHLTANTHQLASNTHRLITNAHQLQAVSPAACGRSCGGLP